MFTRQIRAVSSFSFVAVVVAIGLTAVTAACVAEPDQRGPSGVTTDQAAVIEALNFGSIVLPPTATVLGVRHDRGIDQRYRVAISLEPAAVELLLSGSKFSTPLEPASGPFPPPIDGFDLTKATSVTSTDDRLPPIGDRKQTVHRQVAVDRSEPAKPVMHLWLFTT